MKLKGDIGNMRYPEFDQITIFQMNLTVHMDSFDLHCQLWEISISQWDIQNQTTSIFTNINIAMCPISKSPGCVQIARMI